MATANPNLPGLPEDVREQLRSSRREEALTENQESQSLLTSSPTVIKTWDRRSMKTDMLTGREVPDETKRVPLLAYANPRHVSRSAGVRRLRFVLVAQGGHAGAREQSETVWPDHDEQFAPDFCPPRGADAFGRS